MPCTCPPWVSLVCPFYRQSKSSRSSFKQHSPCSSSGARNRAAADHSLSGQQLPAASRGLPPAPALESAPWKLWECRDAAGSPSLQGPAGETYQVDRESLIQGKAATTIDILLHDLASTQQYSGMVEASSLSRAAKQAMLYRHADKAAFDPEVLGFTGFDIPPPNKATTNLVTGTLYISYVSSEQQDSWEHVIRITGVSLAAVQTVPDMVVWLKFECGLIGLNDRSIRVRDKEHKPAMGKSWRVSSYAEKFLQDVEVVKQKTQAMSSQERRKVRVSGAPVLAAQPKHKNKAADSDNGGESPRASGSSAQQRAKKQKTGAESDGSDYPRANSSSAQQRAKTETASESNSGNESPPWSAGSFAQQLDDSDWLHYLEAVSAPSAYEPRGLLSPAAAASEGYGEPEAWESSPLHRQSAGAPPPLAGAHSSDLPGKSRGSPRRGAAAAAAAGGGGGASSSSVPRPTAAAGRGSSAAAASAARGRRAAPTEADRTGRPPKRQAAQDAVNRWDWQNAKFESFLDHHEESMAAAARAGGAGAGGDAAAAPAVAAAAAAAGGVGADAGEVAAALAIAAAAAGGATPPTREQLLRDPFVLELLGGGDAEEGMVLAALLGEQPE